MNSVWRRLQEAVLPTDTPAPSGIDINAVLNHVESIVLVIAPDRSIRWASPSMETGCGWKPADIENLQWHTLVHPGDVLRVRTMVRGQGADGSHVELRLRGATGRYRWHRASVQLLSESPDTTYVVELVDIHSEVERRQQMHGTEVALRRLFDDIPETVVEWLPICDASDHVVDLQVLHSNGAFNKRFGGYSMEGRVASAFSPVAMSMIPAVQTIHSNGGESLHDVVVGDDHYQLHLSATERGTVMGVSRHIEAAGGNSVSSTVQDEREHLARVAHTLRTNLSVVQGWTEVLVEADSANDPKMRHEAVERLAVNTSTLLSSVNELMASTAGNGEYHLDLSQIQIEPIMQTAIDDVQTSHRDITFALTAEPDVAARTNATALITVLHHLLENAARFATSQVQLNAVRDGDRIVIDVLDDGPGIAADIELFKAFTPNHRGNGNGVGLNVVKKLVDALEGTVTGDNRTDGPGAHFRVTLPADQAELSIR